MSIIVRAILLQCSYSIAARWARPVGYILRASLSLFKFLFYVFMLRFTLITVTVRASLRKKRQKRRKKQKKRKQDFVARGLLLSLIYVVGQIQNSSLK